MKGNALEIHGLRKKYGQFSLRDVDMVVPGGQTMGLIGQNGAGKSTIIKCILSAIPYDSGQILVGGVDARRNQMSVKRKIGYVSEDARMYGDVSGEALAAFVRQYYPSWDSGLFLSMASRLELDLRKKIKNLSKGNRVKLAVAMATCHHPDLLVLDEPTSGLDPLVRNRVLDILEEHARSDGCSTLFSSHITEDIVRIADTVTYIDNGAVLLSESRAKLAIEYQRVQFADGVPEPVRARFTRCSDNECLVTDTGVFQALCTRIGISPTAYAARSATLDEVLMLLVDGVAIR